jgi:hypothetical protein
VAAEGGATAVDLRLVGSDGVLLARNEGRRGVPMVFHCVEARGHAREQESTARGPAREHEGTARDPAREQPARLVLRSRGRDGTVSLWRGQAPLARPERAVEARGSAREQSPEAP